MNKEEKIKHYATAPRATAVTISRIVDGNLKSYWVGKLRGVIVSFAGNEYKFNTKKEALNCAREFRSACIKRAKKLGIDISHTSTLEE